MDPLLDVADLAAYLNVPVRTIRDWRYRGEGPPALKVGSLVRWRRADIDRWLETRRDRITTP